MKYPGYQEHWPDAWKAAWRYDREEVFGPVTQLGYARAYENRRKRTLKLLAEVIPPGGRVLDIAAAQGNFSLQLAELGYDVTWNDLRAELEGYVRLKHERGTIHYAPGNAFDLQFPAAFDAVLITEIIEHVAHPDQFLVNTARLLKPGGWIIMTTPNGAYFKNNLPRFSDCPDPSVYESAQFRPNSDGHIFLLHPEEIETLAARAGLMVEKMEIFTNPLTTGHLKTEALLKALPRCVVAGIETLTCGVPRRISQRFLVQIGARLRCGRV